MQKPDMRRFLMDTNLLVLLIVGRSDPSWILSFKRTKVYTPDEYDRLESLLRQASGLVSTPNILTETSNLLNAATGGHRLILFQTMAELIEGLDEVYVQSRTAASNVIFPDFGLTDMAILDATRETESIALTDDSRLAGQLAIQDLDVINFNHLR
ncbi:MAG: hypothetical protein ACE37H_09535 [Phycisphaeraceae bacterium]